VGRVQNNCIFYVMYVCSVSTLFFCSGSSVGPSAVLCTVYETICVGSGNMEMSSRSRTGSFAARASNPVASRASLCAYIGLGGQPLTFVTRNHFHSPHFPAPLFFPDLVDLGVITAFEASVLKDRIAGNDPAIRQALSLFEATGDASLVRCECGARWGRG
jgi:hypothetical protein